MKILYKSALVICSFLAALSANYTYAQELSIESASDWGGAHSSFPASNAIDGDTSWSSRWAANVDSTDDDALNLLLNLGSVQEVTEVAVAWGKGQSQTYTFEIRARAATSGSWTKVYSGTSSGTTEDYETYDITDIDAQQVRVKIFSNSAGTSWTDIIEVQIFGSDGGSSVSSSGTTYSIPGLIEAEEFSDYYDTDSSNRGGDYRTDESVDVEICEDSGCGYNVGWMYTGEWLEYEIDVDSSGNYQAQVRLASEYTTGQLSFEIDGSSAGSTLSVENSGDWQTYITQTVDLGYISSGSHTLRFNVENTGFNLNWINIVASESILLNSVATPSLIEAEDFTAYYDLTTGNRGGEYRTDEDVDIELCEDTDCGYNVGWMDDGEWLQYDITVTTADYYYADMRLATEHSDSQFSISIDGTDVTGNVDVTTTTDWQDYSTESVDLGYLSAGDYTLQVNVVDGPFNFNWMDIQQGEATESTGDFGLDPDLEPWENFDLSIWSLDTPATREEDNCKADRTYDYEWYVSGFSLDDSAPYFYTHTDGGMRFESFLGGETTSDDCGSGYVRSELREMLRAGDTDIDDTGDTANNWALGYQPENENLGGRNGVLSTTLRVNQVTTTGDDSQIGRVIIGQIHASEDEPLRLYYRHRAGLASGCIYAAHEENGGSDTWFPIVGDDTDCETAPADGIALDELFSYTITNQDDQIDVVVRRGDYDGEIIGSANIDMTALGSGYDIYDEWNYFKAGAYTQNDSGDDTDGDIVTIYRLSTSHDAN